MPEWVVGKIADALNERGKALKGSRVLVLGIAYKEERRRHAGVPGRRDHGAPVNSRAPS